MTLIYPLRPLIVDDLNLISAYNRHPDSRLFMTSRCASPEDVERWLNQGARFDDLILINGAGEKLAQRMNVEGRRDPMIHTGIVRLTFPAGTDVVREIHNWYRGLRNAAFLRGSFLGVTEGNLEVRPETHDT